MAGDHAALPAHSLRPDRMPGHWLLARLGKRVLRPGGLAMTGRILADLAIGGDDHVVELAPGLGVTAQRIVARAPRSYTGIERDPDAVRWIASRLPAEPWISVRSGSAEDTGLADAAATVVIGEAMLSMQPPAHKLRIMTEAYRLLRPGGRYAIHELLVTPDDISPAVKQEIDDALSAVIHVGARPLTEREWRAAMTEAGFTVCKIGYAPMHLLRPARLVADEGLGGALRFLRRLMRDTEARRRVIAMGRAFHRYRRHIRAVSIIACKEPQAAISAKRGGSR